MQPFFISHCIPQDKFIALKEILTQTVTSKLNSIVTQERLIKGQMSPRPLYNFLFTSSAKKTTCNKTNFYLNVGIPHL